MKGKYIVGIIIMVGFIVFGAISLKKSLTPYVSFAQAKQSPETVQIIGKIVEGETYYDTLAQNLVFTLTDKNSHEQMKVIYRGVKPGNFDQAVEIVAIGNYEADAFHSDQLLVKCPSKYQGLENK
ncbi:MAG: hypothetical protein RBG1_1C00001G0421 [candidate division Zixibacteria bacterium RBG-1]|nr:MAG: hypothetical protein RBG1_1C00001G0421 [candidate division Zixibacteria bacterium RBG-1]OGC84771.1 MAG: hypothetical protein A2V73_05620 [candidate division Zixibacteria bacterium RBG_19FT_COMBO_42_43]